MSFTLVNELPSPAEILEQFPLPEKLAALKAERDEEIKKVITGESNKSLLSSDLAPLIMKMLSATIQTVLQSSGEDQRQTSHCSKSLHQ